MLNLQLAMNEQHEQQHTADVSHNNIMDKLYNGEVFQEFVKQWGNASIHYEYKKTNESESMQ